MEQKNRRILNLPNVITFLRLFAIPFMAYYIYTEKNPWIAFALFAGIWCTDILDGYIARHYDLITDFGKIFDPAVDKLFQFTTAISFFLIGKLPLWVPGFIFMKELILVVGGLILLKKHVVVYSEWIGKVATVLYALAFASLFFLSREQIFACNSIFILPTIFATLALIRYTSLHFREIKAPKDKQTEYMN